MEVLAAPRRRALELVRAQPEVVDAQSFGERLHLTLSEAAAPQAEAVALRMRERLEAAGVTVESVRAMLPGLEDIFIARIRADQPGTAEVNS